MENADLSRPRTPTLLKVGSGTAYQLTAVSAAIAPGTVTPVLVLPEPGKWRLRAEIILKCNAATFAATRAVTLKLRRTNNTAADVTNGSRTVDTQVVTTLTYTLVAVIIEADYDTLNSDDSLTIFGDVAVIPSAGSLDVSYVSLRAEKLNVKV